MGGNPNYGQQNYQQPQQPQQSQQYPQYQQQPYGARQYPPQYGYPPPAPKPINYELIFGLLGLIGLLLVGIGALIVSSQEYLGDAMKAGFAVIGIGVIIASLEKLIIFLNPKK